MTTCGRTRGRFRHRRQVMSSTDFDIYLLFDMLILLLIGMGPKVALVSSQ